MVIIQPVREKIIRFKISVVFKLLLIASWSRFYWKEQDFKSYLVLLHIYICSTSIQFKENGTIITVERRKFVAEEMIKHESVIKEFVDFKQDIKYDYLKEQLKPITLSTEFTPQFTI